MKNLIMYVIVTLIVLSFSFGAWHFGRKINYSLSYKSMVKQTIIEMVKEEALNEKQN